MMLDNDARAAAPAFPIQNIEFLRAELSPSLDGRFLVSLTATVVDDIEPQLLDQELLRDSVDSIDAALVLLGEHARRALTLR